MMYDTRRHTGVKERRERNTHLQGSKNKSIAQRQKRKAMLKWT
jgi:hypothetical protein